ncbi:hypothetical protein TWF225_007146 [Orbilia oligospora]|nr:hypothetical protein TWF225_007146 [Orbilia oligospora]KAF3238819.1 hypothetical protein TWF217_001649 [Orbilia oligospora]KAF3287260.1 hypothetical protein TWF132_008628 [Orbilia oligospora]
MHDEGHDTGSEDIICDPSIPSSPHLLEDVEGAIDLADVIVMGPVSPIDRANHNMKLTSLSGLEARRVRVQSLSTENNFSNNDNDKINPEQMKRKRKG